MKIWRKVAVKVVISVSDKLTRRYGERFLIKQSYQFLTEQFYLFLTKMFREMVFNEGCPLALAQGYTDKDSYVEGKVQINCVHKRASLYIKGSTGTTKIIHQHRNTLKSTKQKYEHLQSLRKKGNQQLIQQLSQSWMLKYR